MGRYKETIAVQERVTKVYGLILAGASRMEIIAKIIADYQVSEGTVERYITLARKEIMLRAEEDRDLQYQTAISRYNMLFAKALKMQDVHACIKAQTRLDKIAGLEAPIDMNHKPLEIVITYADQNKPGE
jgi:hypothetical protein